MSELNKQLDNKLKEQIEELLPPIGIEDIEDVAVKFIEWYHDRANGLTDKLVSELFYKHGGVTYNQYFKYFINNIYQKQ